MGLFGRKKQSPNPASASRASGNSGQEISDPKDLLVTLFPQEIFEGPAGYDVKQPLPGLVAPITLDEGDSMRSLWENLDRAGMSADAAYEHAISNLRSLPVDLTTINQAPVGEPYTTVHFLSAQDGFASGRIFLIDDLLLSTGEEFPDHGILVCVPNAVSMAIHVPRDAGVLGGISKLMEIAQGEYLPEWNGISPHVFLLLPDGSATQCTQFTDEGGMAINAMSGPLHAMLLKLGVINT